MSAKRRYTDKIRYIADLAWAHGEKEMSERLHAIAREAEAERNNVTQKREESEKA